MIIMDENTGKRFSSVEDAVKQSILRVIRTRIGSLELHREFGSGVSKYLDAPMNEVQAHVGQEIISALGKWIPKLRVHEIDFSGSKGTINAQIAATYEGGKIKTHVNFARL